MYSVVLMTALTTGGATADFHFRRGCFGWRRGCYASHGCAGCYGGCYGSYGCHGCQGGFGCAGCYGGYGCAGYGFHGYGHACFSAYQCHGCYNCSGWVGCHGCYGCYAPAMPTTPPNGGEPPNGEQPEEDGEPAGDASGSDNTVRSKLTVELPEDAKLYVDNVLMKTDSSERVFMTPPLQKGNTYYYILKAEMVRDGQTVEVSGRVIVRPGQNVHASLSEPSAQGTFVVKSDAVQ